MSLMHGKFLQPLAFAEEGTYIRPPSNLVSDEGMSGFGGAMHTMNLNCEAMWLSARDVTKNVYAGFDFGSVLRLGYMYVWNFNQLDGYGASIKKADILYSLDGKDYKLFKSVVFAPANGTDALKATNLDDGKNSPLDFEGLSARYIKIVPDIKSGEGCWGKYVEGQIRYGLSKVRFFLYRTEPKKNGEAYATAFNPAHNVLTSCAGLDKEGLGTNAEEMFLSPAYPREMDMIFDINMSAKLSGFDYINYNVAGFLGAGIKKATVSVSLDATSWKSLGEYDFDRASGKDGEPFRSIKFASDEYARFIKLTVIGGGGVGTHGFCNGFEYRYGFGKIRFKFSESGYYTEVARDWTALLSNYDGWNGADGLFSIAMDGDESKRDGQKADDVCSMFLFSDSFLGNINPVSGARRLAYMVNNTMAYLKGTRPEALEIEFVYGKDGKKTPDNILKKGSDRFHYWMQDCAVINNKFYVFTDNVVSFPDDDSLPEGFKFRIDGVDLLEFDIKDGRLDYNSQKSHKTPLFTLKPKSIMYGCGVLVNTKEGGMPNADGYVYIYGQLDVGLMNKKLLCSRVKVESFTDFSKYEYFDGKGWSKNILDSEPISDDVSAEMSVMPIDSGSDKGKYLYVYSPASVGTTVSSCVADTPFGPFENPKELYNIAKVDDLNYDKIKKVYCYNAKAHYHIAEKGEVLISYNVNSMDYESHFSNGHIYRPRFLRYREF